MFLQAHNEFVEWYFIAGGIGFIIGLVFLFTYLRTSWANRDRIPFMGLVMGCVASSALFCWHEAPLVIITVLYLGMIRADGMKEAGHESVVSVAEREYEVACACKEYADTRASLQEEHVGSITDRAVFANLHTQVNPAAPNTRNS